MRPSQQRRLRQLACQLCQGGGGSAEEECPRPKLVTPEQLQHYREKGYVLLKSLLSPEEVADLRAEVEELIHRAPCERGSKKDKEGNAVPGGPEYYNFTDPVKGDDPRTFTSTRSVLNRINYMFNFAPAALRCAGNPKVLQVAEDIYGADFVPFSESYVVKPPEDGAGFCWHQDTGTSVNFPYPWQPERGINLGIYLHESTVENGCLMVVPGSQKTKADMEALTAKQDRGKVLPGAVAVPCSAGDVIVHARNVIHGSMPNTSQEIRGTLYLGFMPAEAVRRLHPAEEVQNRQAIIPRCYVASRQGSKRFPEETPFTYKGLDERDQLRVEKDGAVNLLDRTKFPVLQI